MSLDGLLKEIRLLRRDVRHCLLSIRKRVGERLESRRRNAEERTQRRWDAELDNEIAEDELPRLEAAWGVEGWYTGEGVGS